MSDKALADAACELLNTKERLIYHLIKVIQESMDDGFQKCDSDQAPEAAETAIYYLIQLGYSPGERWGMFPKDRTRWDFMLESGEPGTHLKPKTGGRAHRAEEIERALFGMLATLNTAIQGGQISHSEQIDRAIANAGKALG